MSSVVRYDRIFSKICACRKFLNRRAGVEKIGKNFGENGEVRKRQAACRADRRASLGELPQAPQGERTFAAPSQKYSELYLFKKARPTSPHRHTNFFHSSGKQKGKENLAFLRITIEP